MINKILAVLTFLFYSTLIGYGQDSIDGGVQEIIKQDSVHLQIQRIGCFGGSIATTTIMKQSADSFLVTSKDFAGYQSSSKIGSGQLSDFGRLFSSEMNRKPLCRCTTSQNFTLSSGKKQVQFSYRCCTEKITPGELFQISLGLMK